MPTALKSLRVTRVDLVDNGANQDDTGDGAHVLLFKRADADPQEANAMPSEAVNEATNAEDLQAVVAERDSQIETLQKSQEEQNAVITQLQERIQELEGASPVADEPVEEEVVKGLSDEVRKMLADRDEQVQKALDRAAEAEAVAKAERDTRLHREFVAKAEEMPSIQGEVEQIARDLRSLNEGLDEDVAKRISGYLSGLDDLVKKSALFATHSRRDATEQTVRQSVEKAAKELVESGKASTIEQARDTLFQRDPSLAQQYREQQ